MKKIILFLCLSVSFNHLAHSKPSKKPDRLLFLVFDQMRPDYIDRFDLKNFKRLRAMGTNYKNAYVGHFPSLTVVSHIVMTTGLLPKDLPWGDATVVDTKGLWGTKDKIVDVEKAPQESFLKAMSSLPEEKHFIQQFKKSTNKKVFSIGQKDYATMAMGGPYADSLIYMKKSKDSKFWVPQGANVPLYIQSNKRYELDATYDYGTKNSFYPIEGNKYFPGDDKSHLGGDIWVADVGLEIMKKEKNWGALFMTFGAIDKFGHMLGETDGEIPLVFETPAHLKDIVKIADEQLGRLFKQLEDDKILDSTLIISTADHGAQTDSIYLGTGKPKTEPFWVGQITQNSNVSATEQDSSLRVWLSDTSEENLKNAVKAAKTISGATKVYTLDRSTTPVSYKSVYDNSKKESVSYLKWAKAHEEELLRSSASERSADVVVLLGDGVGFGKLGDHGGIQEKVQRIPILIAGPGIKKQTSLEPKRLVDLVPLMSKAFEISK